MELWQEKAAAQIANIISGSLSVERVKFYGSILDRDSLDIFSDVDMEVHLAQQDFNMNDIITTLSKHYKIFGYEMHKHSESELLRICFETGWRFDITFFLKQKEIKPAEKLNSTINQFWYIAAMILVKLGRGDFLTASHLSLELCQLVITVQMQQRDIQKNTNTHRFGDKENVPIFSSLLNLSSNETMEEKILSVLYLAAQHMDNTTNTNKSSKLKSIQATFETSTKKAKAPNGRPLLF